MDDIKRMQHNIIFFLRSKFGHSLKMNIKLLGHEPRSKFLHYQTTPSESHVGISFGLSVSILHSENFGFHWRQLSNSSGNIPRFLEIMSMKILNYGCKLHHILTKRLHTTFSCLTYFVTLSNQRLSCILDSCSTGRVKLQRA